MKKLEKKELRKMAIKNMKERIYSISDVFFQSEEVRKSMIDCFETGYRYSETKLEKSE